MKKWIVKNVIGAGWELYEILPKGFKFLGTHEADGKTEYKIWELKKEQAVLIGYEQWIQFEPEMWKDLQKENAAILGNAIQTQTLLEELYHLVNGECPSLLNEDSGGNGELAIKIEKVLNKL